VPARRVPREFQDTSPNRTIFAQHCRIRAPGSY
jgi:hypothetical protein